MNDDERRLAEFLHGVTPQPPHELDVEQIMRRGSAKGGGFRYWPQLAAAGVVALLAVGTAFAVDSTSVGSNQASGPSPTSSSAPLPCNRLRILAESHLFAAEVLHVVTFTVRNDSSVTCSVQGPVAFGVVNSTKPHPERTQLPITGSSIVAPITLDAGQRATTRLTWIDDPQWSGKTYQRLGVSFGKLRAYLASGPTLRISDYPAGDLHAGKPTLRFSALVKFLRAKPTTTAAPSPTSTNSTAPTTTHSASPSKTATPTSGPGKTRDCELGMKPSIGARETVHGTVHSVNLYFRNNSGKPCSTYAAPGLLALQAHKDYGIMILPVHSGFLAGVIRPGELAFSRISWTQDPKLKSTKYTRLSVDYPIVRRGKSITLPYTMNVSQDANGNPLIAATGIRPHSG